MPALNLSNYLAQLQDDPEDVEAFEGLRELLANGDTQRLGDEPVRLLELARGRHEQRGELRAFAWLVEIEAALVKNDPDLEAALWKELARVRHEELLDDEGAREAYVKALELRPGDEEVREAIERLELTASNWREIANRFIEESDEASDASLKASLRTRAAALVWQYRKKGRDKEADKLFRSAVEADASDTRAANLYAETLRARERWAEMADVLYRAAESTRNRDEKMHLYLRAARVLANRVQDQGRAAAGYERVLDFAPGHQEALRFLVEYFTEREEWEHLVALYEDALRSRQKLEDERGILLQIGMVHWRIRGDAVSAEPYFARLRKIDPAHPGMLDFYRQHYASPGDQARLLTILADAQRVATEPRQKLGLAVEVARAAERGDMALERAIDAWKVVQRLDSTHEDAHAALKRLYAKAEKWNALVELLKMELESVPKDARERRIELLRELVPIYRDHLQLDVMVINTYNAILAEVPDDREALEQLARTYEPMGRWNDLIQVLSRQAEATRDEQTKVELHTRVARLWIERFANYNQATRPLEQVIAIDPDNREALAQLKDIYTKKRAWNSLYEVLRREADLEEDATVRLALRQELAILAGERLHRHADAIAMWREVIAADPTTPGALDALEKLAEREKDWETLAQTLKTRVDQASEPRDRVKLLQKLGAVYSEHLHDPVGAADAWKRVLELEPRNGRAMRTLREAYLAAQDWHSLEELYGETEDWEGLVDVLGNAAQNTPDAALKVELSFRAARIYEGKLGKPMRAFRSYERVLSVEPKNRAAVQALIPIYERDEKWPRLRAMLELDLEAWGSDTPARERVLRLDRLRALCIEKLHDAAAAFTYAAQAYRLSPVDDGLVSALERAASEAGATDELVRLYVERLEQSPPEDEALRLRRRIAVLAAEQLGRSELAIKQWLAVLELAPSDPEALAALEDLYRREKRTKELGELYLHRVRHEPDEAIRHKLLRDLAAFEETELGNVDAAAERLKAALEIDPTDRAALQSLDRLGTARGRWDEVAQVLRRLQDLETGQARVAISLRLARVFREHLEDRRGALDTYSDILQVDRSNAEAIAGLESIAATDPALALDAGRLLETAYEAVGDHRKLADVWKRRLEGITDPQEKRELRLRLAELEGEVLGEAEAGYRVLESAFLDQPEDVELWDALAAAAERAGKHEDLAEAYATAIEAGGLSDGDVSELAGRVGEVYDVLLGRPADAERFHRIRLSHDPLDEKAFLALKELYTNLERWDDLQSLYRNRIAQTVDGDAKLELLLQVCFLFEEILDDPDLAIRAYQDVLDLQPSHPASRRALERLYRKTERYADLAALLRQELDTAKGQDAVDLLFELGTLFETMLRDAASAVDQYEAVLEHNPTHLRSQEALERLMPDRGQRQRIAGILEPLYAAQGAWGELARVLEVQLEDRSEEGARVDVLVRLADIHEHKLHDPKRAFDAITRAVLADPGVESSRRELARLAAVGDRHDDRAAVIERAIEATGDSTMLQSDLLHELGVLWTERREPAKAERAWSRLIGVDADNPEIVLPAARALEAIHAERGDSAALADDLRLQIRFEMDPAARGRLLVRLADLLETKLGDVDGAIAAHRERIEADPSDLKAMDALARLYEQREEWQKLIGVLQTREAVVQNEEEQRDLARRIGEIYETRLDDRDNAIVAYNDVLSRFGQDRITLGALARLYEQTEKWEDLLEVVQMQLSLTEDAYDRADLRFRAAELMRLRTGDLDAAIEGYADVLETTPNHAGAVAALEQVLATAEGEPRVRAAKVLAPRYENAAAHAPLLGALEVLAESDEPVERLRALRRAAEVAELGLEDVSRAYGFAARAVRVGLGEDDLPVMFRDLERLAAASDGWSSYLRLLQEIAPDVLNGDLHVEVLLKIADVARTRLGEPEIARTYYGKVLEQYPDHALALDALEELHLAAGDKKALLAILRRKTELAESADARQALLLRQARLCETALNDVDGAVDAYEQVLAETDKREAYEGLERLYERGKRFSDLVSLYERQLERKLSDAAELHYKLGRTYLVELNDPDAALEHFRAVLAQRNDHEPTVALLRELMSSRPEYRASAAEILEPVFLARMDWGNVTAALEARLDAETSLDERKSLLRRLGQIHEDYLEDLDGALETYARLFREDPADQEVCDTLARLARVLDRWGRLAEIYESALDDITIDDPSSVKLAFQTGQLHDQRTGRLPDAAKWYERSLRFDPTDGASFDALESVYQRMEAWDSLLRLYRERMDVAESVEQRLDLLHKSAQLKLVRLHDPEAGIELYREMLEADPADSRAVLGLDHVLTEQKRWSELADHLRHRIEMGAGGADEVELKFRLGELLADRLTDAVSAIDVFEDITQVRPNHEPTVRALEKLVQGLDHRLRITRILEPLYRASDQWKKLVAIHEAQVELVTDPLEQVRLLGEVARLLEQRGHNPGLAFNAWARAFVLDPTAEDVRRELDRLADGLSAWDAHVAAYEEAIAANHDPLVTSQLLTTVARVHDEKRGDPRSAIQTYERLLEHDPDDVAPLDALEALHTLVGDWSGMVDVLVRKVERVYDPAERGELLRRAGSVLEELIGDLPRAMEMYGRAAAEDDTDVVALESLDRLYSNAGRLEDLAEVLRRRIDLTADEDERVDLGMRLARLYERELRQPTDAIEAYRRVTEDRPHHGEAVEALGRLFEQRSMWPELLENLKERIEVATPAEKVPLLYRSGEVLERELDDVVEAMTRYEAVLAIEPRHEPSIAALVRVAQLEDYRGPAIEVLEPLFEKLERWNDLAPLLERKIESAMDPVEKCGELRRLARVQEERRGDKPAAFDALARALAEDASNPALVDELERIAAELGTWSEFADVLALRASTALEPAVARALYARLARVAEQRLSDDARAIEAWSRSLEQIGDDPDLLRELERLYAKTERWQELADVLERRIQIAGEGERVELLTRAARLREERFQDLRGAFTAWQEVLEQSPSDSRALEAMERLVEVPELALDVVDVLDATYRQLGSLDKVVGLSEVRIRLAETDGERVRLLQDAAMLWENELGDPGRALDAMRRALLLDARDEALVVELERLAMVSGEWSSLRGVVEEAVLADLDRLVKRDLYLRGATWYRDQLRDDEQAEVMLRAALAEDSESLEAHAQLVELLRKPGREADLVTALRRFAEVESDENRKERLREAARVAESALSDVELAAACYEAVLVVDEGDPEALAQLSRLRRDQGRFEDVVALLERRDDVESDPQERVRLRRDLARLYQDALGNVPKAIEAWRRVLDESVGDADALAALEALYEREKRWDDLKDLLDRRLDLASNDAERISVRVRLARLMEQAFKRREEAMEQLQEILEMDPGNGEALDELERLLMIENDWPRVVELLERRIANARSAGDSPAELALLVRLAEIREKELDDPVAAREVYERILERDPRHLASLQALVRLHEANESWADVADVLQRSLEVVDGTEAIEAARKLAVLADDRLGDAARAEAALRRAFEVELSLGITAPVPPAPAPKRSSFPPATSLSRPPLGVQSRMSSSAPRANATTPSTRPDARVPTRELLRAHYEKHGQRVRMIEVLALEEERTNDPRHKGELLKTMAELCRSEMNDPGRAMHYLERALAIVPDDRNVLLPLCDLYIEAGRERDAIPVLQRIVESFGGRRPKELAQYHHQLGRAYERMGDTDAALEQYDAAFKIDLTNVHILRDLGRLCHVKGDLDRAQKTFRALLLQKLDKTAGITKADVYYYLGDISAKQGDKPKAISMLERAVAEQSDHADAKSLLGTLRG